MEKNERAGIDAALEVSEASCTRDAQGHCLTCSDEALPARVVHVEHETGIALVEIQCSQQEVDITLVEGIEPEDWLLVHGGVAIARMDHAEAHEARHA